MLDFLIDVSNQSPIDVKLGKFVSTEDNEIFIIFLCKFIMMFNKIFLL
jgi:hypothetical protein